MWRVCHFLNVLAIVVTSLEPLIMKDNAEIFSTIQITIVLAVSGFLKGYIVLVLLYVSGKMYLK